MAGQGKYTVFAPPATAQNTLLNKLFHSSDPVEAPTVQDLVGQETQARAAVLAIAIANLQPAHTAGDMGYFPTGVDLNFDGAPDTSKVVWANPGDPANAYVPDISSPGPGKTDGTDKATDPQIKFTDIDPNYTPGAPGTGTESPTAAVPKLVAASTLGVAGVLGNSGGNP